MYSLRDLKTLIKNKSDINLPIVFRYKSTSFLAREYTDAICKLTGAETILIDNLEDTPSDNPLLGGKSIFLYNVPKLNARVPLSDNVIIITKDILKDVSTYYESYVVEVPDPTMEQVQDFVKTRCPGLDKDYVGWLADVFGMEITKLSEELDKIAIFPPDAQDSIFEDMYENDLIDVPDNDTTSLRISSAVQNRDTGTLKGILSRLDTHKAEHIAIISLLHNSFEKLIKVQLNTNPTPENTGIKQNQIWAIKRSKRMYDEMQLVKDFKLVSGMDRKIRAGEFPAELTLDYLLIKILGNVA